MPFVISIPVVFVSIVILLRLIVHLLGNPSEPFFGGRYDGMTIQNQGHKWASGLSNPQHTSSMSKPT